MGRADLYGQPSATRMQRIPATSAVCDSTYTAAPAAAPTDDLLLCCHSPAAMPISTERWSFTGFLSAMRAFDIAYFIGVLYIVGACMWSVEALWSFWTLKSVRGCCMHSTSAWLATRCSQLCHASGQTASRASISAART
jgi:hypothetical protein